MKSINFNKTTCCLAIIFSAHVSAENLAATPNESVVSDTIETITVISSKSPSPTRELATSVSVITKQDIEAIGDLSLANIMRHQVSIGVSNSGGMGKNTTLRIRGEDGFRTKVYMDGVELSDPTAPQATPIFDDIMSSFIERVEILRGPQGLMYGADSGGVVSITTTQFNNGLQGALNAEFGRYATQSVSGELGFANNDGHVYMAMGEIETDGFNARTSDTSGEKDAYKNSTLHLNTGYNINQDLSLNFVLRQVDSDNEYDGCYDNTTFALINSCLTQGSNQTARLALQYQQADTSHTLGYAKTKVEREFYSDNQFSYGSEGNINKLEYAGFYNFTQQKLIWGLDNEIQKIVSSQIEREQNGAYVEYQNTQLSDIFLSAGLRYDNNETFGNHSSYRLSAAYLLPLVDDQFIKFKSTLGTGFRAPSLYEQDYNDGAYAYGEAAGLQLKEETSKGFDIGLEYSSPKQLASLVFFNQTITNEIYFDSIGYQGYLQNTLSSDSKGMELEYSYIVSPRSKLVANYTFNETKTSEQEVRLRRPKHQANLGWQTSLLADELKLNIYLNAIRDLVDIGNQPLDNYELVNASSHYQLNSWLSLKLRIDNVFNVQYQEVAGFNTAGRSAYIGLNAIL